MVDTETGNPLVPNEYPTPTVLVIDDFYQDPMAVREWVLQQDFPIEGNYPGKRTAPFAVDAVKDKIESYVEPFAGKITQWSNNENHTTSNGTFQFTLESDVSWMHTDNNVTDWAGVLYLTPDAPVSGGTGLFRFQDGTRFALESEDLTPHNENAGNFNAWEQLDNIGNVFNRLVLFNAQHWHRSLDYFGDCKENGRLFQTFFFSTERRLINNIKLPHEWDGKGINTETGAWSFEDATHEWDGKGKGHGSCQSLKPLFEKYLSKDSPVIDMGCGLGDYIHHLSGKGFEVYGFDGTPNIDDCSIYHPVLEADLTKPLAEQITIPNGNVISLEVGEHIPLKYESELLDNLTQYCTDTLILSWAIPGQGGHGHFNEQSNAYVIERVQERGLKYDESSTNQFRNELAELINHNPVDSPWSFFLNTIMIFKREGIRCFEFGSLAEIDSQLDNLENANIYITSLYNWGNPSDEIRDLTREMYELSRDSYFQNLADIDVHVLLTNPGIDGDLRGQDSEYHGDVFHDMFLKTHHLWMNDNNIFYADIDTICVKPTKIFGEFDKFSMFNGVGAGTYQDSHPKWRLDFMPDAHLGYGQLFAGVTSSEVFGDIHLPAYFNDGVRYFPKQTDALVWEIGFNKWEDWKSGNLIQRWGEQQIIHNMMMYEGQNWQNDYTTLNRPDLNHLDYGDWDEDTEVFLTNPENLLYMPTYYPPFRQDLNRPSSIYHVFGSRGLLDSIKIMRQLLQREQ